MVKKVKKMLKMESEIFVPFPNSIGLINIFISDSFSSTILKQEGANLGSRLLRRIPTKLHSVVGNLVKMAPNCAHRVLRIHLNDALLGRVLALVPDQPGAQLLLIGLVFAEHHQHVALKSAKIKL